MLCLACQPLSNKLMRLEQRRELERYVSVTVAAWLNLICTLS